MRPLLYESRRCCSSCVRVSMTMACCWAGGCVVASSAAGLVAASRLDELGSPDPVVVNLLVEGVDDGEE